MTRFDKLLIAMLLLVADPAPAGAQTHNVPPVKATLAILETKYCEGDAVSDVLQFRARVTATNVSRTPLIHSGDAEVAKILVSTTEPSVLGERFTVEPHYVYSSDGSNSPEHQVTKPGHKFTFSADGFLLVGEHPSESVLGPGTYWVRLLLVPRSEEQEDQSSSPRNNSKLSKRGRLWTEPTLSEPVRIEVSSHPNLKRCGSFR